MTKTSTEETIILILFWDKSPSLYVCKEARKWKDLHQVTAQASKVNWYVNIHLHRVKRNALR